MNMYKILLIVIFVLFSLFTLIGRSPVFSEAEIEMRLKNLTTVIDIKMTDVVKSEIIQLITKRRSDSEIILGRTSIYFPIIENELRKQNVPDEFKYLAAIESSLQPFAASHRGAVGLWQFTKSTAKIRGLIIDKYIDERIDPIKSSEKAAAYLNILYELYNDWTLALAAYNCGPGNVNKAIKKSGGASTYWDILPYLPKETQQFVPRFIAMSYLMNYYYTHDLSPREIDPFMQDIVTLKVTQNIDFVTISQEFSIDIDLVKKLNPMYKKNKIIVSNNNDYYLSLPENIMYSFVDKYSDFSQLVYMPKSYSIRSYAEVYASNDDNTEITLPVSNPFNHIIWDDSRKHKYVTQIPLQFVSTKRHRLKRKESLEDVAATYNIELDKLMTYNNIQSDSKISIGRVILLP